MTILALDTTSEFGSLAVRANGQTAAELALHSPEGFAHVIFQAIEKLLGDAGIPLDQIDCFVAASGPGSFTGVRVGLSAVKGLAEAMGKPALGVSNLRAMSSFGNLAHRAVVLDARRGEVFAAIYNAHLEIVVPETVLKLSTWLETLVLPSYEFIWMSGAPFRSGLEGTRFAEMPFVEVPRNLAAAVALCAELDGQSGKWLDPAVLDANYVRRSDAELFWKEG
ncbi:MAG: tRNA (adenosine(37)-N6)-threonylcarbamoyltransferase complex dimerization subunit type 1 TsaB [Bryobacteraceae bacterium]